VQPPMKCAVSGRLNGSPIDPPALPPITSAILRTAWLATGIQVGFGCPWPCFEVSFHRRVSRFRVEKVVIELSIVCITRATTVRSDQCRTSYRSRTLARSLHISFSHVRQRGSGPSPSVSTVCRNDIRLLPLP
jgi:hypothetical protein